MIRKAFTSKAMLEDLPREKQGTHPFKDMWWVLKGYVHAVVIVDENSGYRWLYEMKTTGKDEMNDVVKKWYTGTAISQTFGIYITLSWS